MLTAVAAVFLVVYVFGIPAFYFVQLFRRRHELFKVVSPASHKEAFFSEADGKWYVADEKSLVTYGFLFGSYEPRYFWWETNEMVKKAFFTGLLIFVVPGSPSQIVIAMLAALFYIVLYSYCEPYVDDTDDVLARASFCCTEPSFTSMQFLVP